MSLKPICVPCQRFFRMSKTGYYFIEAMPYGAPRPQPGTAEPEHWTPYKVWSGDLWRCEGCGTTIVSGVAQRPITEHYQGDFAATVTKLNATQLQVNDC